MEKLTRLLNRLANWKTIVVLILIALPFNWVIFPMRSARLQELAGKSISIIDVMFAYTPAQVYELVPAYGEQGRQLYALTELTVDLVYPILYNLLLSLLMAIIFRGGVFEWKPMAQAAAPAFSLLVGRLFRECRHHDHAGELSSRT